MKLHNSLRIPLYELINKRIINEGNAEFIIIDFVLDVESTRVKVVIQDGDDNADESDTAVLDLEALSNWTLVYTNF